MLILKKKQFGFSMVEVLVSLIVIAVGLLGLAGLQITSMKGTSNAHSLNVASMIAMELSDRMRANLAGVDGTFYENDVNCNKNENACRTAKFCNAQQISRIDVQDLMCGVLKNGKREGGVVNLLPNSTLLVDQNVDCDPNVVDVNETSITISWSDANTHIDQQGSVQNQTMTICTIP